MKKKKESGKISFSTIRNLGFVTMVIDHVGVAFFASNALFRIPGRFCYPIFAYLLTIGFKKTKDPIRYLFRLLLCAIAAQYPFSCIAKGTLLNSIFTLALGLVGLEVVKRAKLTLFIESLMWVALAAMSMFLHLDYGAYGIILIGLISHYKNNRQWWIIWASFFTIFYFLHLSAWYQVFAFFTPFLWMSVRDDQKKSRFGYWFYPIHLWIILGIAKLINV